MIFVKFDAVTRLPTFTCVMCMLLRGDVIKIPCT